LFTAAKFFARSKLNFDITQRIFNDSRMNSSDFGDRLRGYFLQLLQTSLDDMRPDQVNSFVNWTMSGRLELAEPIDGRKQLNANEVPLPVWEKISDQLHQRWVKTDDLDE